MIFAIIHKVKLPTTTTTFLIQAQSPPPVNKKIDKYKILCVVKTFNVDL